jgi:hypothetical protein
MLYCGFTILPTKLRKLRDSTASRVRELKVVIRIGFLLDASSAFRFYAEGLTQDGIQLVAYIVRICAWLGRSLMTHHVSQLRCKGKLWWGFITKVVGF